MSELIFPLLFFLIAFVYSSAGFGGGSMYLAVLAEASWPGQLLKFAGLLCNAVVTGNGTLRFLMNRWLNWRKSRFILMSSVIPCMITSAFPLDDRWYMLTLGFALCTAAIAIAISTRVEHEVLDVSGWWIYPASACIGALAGVTGIGGGVYLAPLLYLTRWGSPKEIAALTSIFILVNSAAGLIIQYVCFTITIPPGISWLILAVALGGYLGSGLGSGYFSQRFVKWTTVVIMLFAGSKMIWKNL